MALTSPLPEEDSLYPKNWAIIPHYPAFESRQLSEDTYQIRSKTHQITVNKEGYDLFLSEDRPNSWAAWMEQNHVVSFRREDVQ